MFKTRVLASESAGYAGNLTFICHTFPTKSVGKSLQVMQEIGFSFVSLCYSFVIVIILILVQNKSVGKRVCRLCRKFDFCLFHFVVIVIILKHVPNKSLQVMQEIALCTATVLPVDWHWRRRRLKFYPHLIKFQLREGLL